MALTLVATAGGATANSYATAAEGDAYHEAHLYASDWTGASTATKEAALVMATRVLDSLYEWEGWAATDTQALLWPRNAVLDFRELSYIDPATVPQRLKDATAELARQLIAEDRTVDNQIETQGITALTAGPVSLEFKDSVYAKVMPDAVRNLIPAWWGTLREGGSSRPIARA